MNAPRTLVVWCPDWPITAAGFPPDAPVAVVHANRVVASSAAARAEGVRRGLRRREAQGRCPQLEVLEHDPARDARSFEPVVALIETFTTGVEILRPGVCAFATRGPSRYFGGDDALVVRVMENVGELTSSQAGIADGVFAATLAARRGPLVVPAGASASFLAPFPVGTLEIPDLVDLLRRLGIDTLGRFAAVPESDVLARFGHDGVIAHRRARGLDDRPLDARVAPPDLVISVELDPPAERVDAAAFAAKAMGDDLHLRLARLGLACTRLRVEAETEHGEGLARVWRHDGPFTPATIAERVRWQLDGWLSGTSTRQRPTAGISLLRLVPEEVAPDDGRQLGFWGADAAAHDRAARALARVQGLLGPDGVQTAVLRGGRGPAERVHLVPWGDPRDNLFEGGDAPWPGRIPSPSPATVPASPIPAEVTGEDGEPVSVTGRVAVSSPPRRLSVAGGAWTGVAAWAGPWPVDERWWDPPAHRRRARFQVETDDGVVRLLTVEGGGWTVEALYD